MIRTITAPGIETQTITQEEADLLARLLSEAYAKEWKAGDSLKRGHADPLGPEFARALRRCNDTLGQLHRLGAFFSIKAQPQT